LKVNFTGKKLVAIFILVIFTCFFSGLFSGIIFASSEHECSCCQSSCGCQLDLCFLNQNPLFFLGKLDIIPVINLRDYLPQEATLMHPKDIVRNIFHPPTDTPSGYKRFG